MCDLKNQPWIGCDREDGGYIAVIATNLLEAQVGSRARKQGNSRKENGQTIVWPFLFTKTEEHIYQTGSLGTYNIHEQIIDCS